MIISRVLGLALISTLLFSAHVFAGLAPSAGRRQPGMLEHPHLRLRQILEQPAFQQWRLREKAHVSGAQNPLDEAISRQWDRLMKWLQSYFHSHRHRVLGGERGHADFSFAGFLEAAGLVLGIALVAAIVVVFFRWRGIGKTPAAGADELVSRKKIQQAMEQGDALAMASDSWMRAARQFGVDGDFRAMYRAMYLSLLAGLHETGKIRFRRNRTNWHYVHDFHGGRPERELFVKLTDLFDHVWYGRKLYPSINPDSLRDQISRLMVKPDQAEPLGASGQGALHGEGGRA